MSLFVIVIAFALGAVAVLQGGINRQISTQWGLAPAIVLNNLIIFLLGLALYIGVRFLSDGTLVALRTNKEFTNPAWWYFLPGFFGLCLVAGIPLAISKVGALKVFTAIIAGQVIVSLLWDAYQEGTPISLIRVVGAAMTVGGVLIISWKS